MVYVFDQVKILYVSTIFIVFLELVLSVVTEDYDLIRMSDELYEIYYMRKSDRFNQKKLDPRDFYLSMYNPYFRRIPKPQNYFTNYVNDMFYNDNDYSKYGQRIQNVTSMTVSPEEYKKMVHDNVDSYCQTKTNYYALNRNLIHLYSAQKYLKTLGKPFKFDYVKVLREKIQKQEKSLEATGSKSGCFSGLVSLFKKKKSTEPLRSYETSLQNLNMMKNRVYTLRKSEVQLIKDDKGFEPTVMIKQLENDEHDKIKSLMYLLPSLKDDLETYSIYYSAMVEFLYELNPNSEEKYDPNSLEPLTQQLLNDLKSPILLKHENYNFHMIRLKFNGFIPFHFQFYKEKYKVFEDFEEARLANILDII